ncbi:hypothetical protein, partial [uncultured Dubosiella sp.]|uniref:hypothetical protein n=1 Tax=uncultured Dubosiella sp. TaxID=1937011 RepID=UPI0025B58553
GKESDELNLSITKKTYRLIRTTQNLILDKKEMDEIIHFSILILNIIDKTLTNGPQEIHNLYLKKGYSEWLKKTDINWKSKRSKGSGMRTRWEPKFIAYDEQVFLVPPNHRIHNHYDYDQIKIEVYNGTEKIYQNSNPTMKEIVGGYEIEQKRINLSAPLGKIRYRVKAGEEDVIYDSGDALFRHFIVFDLKGNEIKNNHDYSGTVAVCQKDTGEVQPYFKADQYCFTSRSVQVGSIIKIAGEAFNFSALIKPGVVGEEIEKSALISESGRKVKIFKDMKYVIFESEKNENDLFYELDGQIVPISEKKFSKSKNNLVYRYVIVMGKIDSGMHRVRILRRDGNRKKTVFSELFVVDHQLLYEARMIGGNRIFISVQSDLFDYLIEKEIEIHEFREDLIAVKIQTELYYLRLPFDLPIYQLDDNEWKAFEDELWIGDIKPDINIDTDDDGKPYKSNNPYIAILLKRNDKKTVNICCYNKCSVNEQKMELLFDPQEKLLNIVPSFLGKGNTLVQVLNDSGAVCFKEYCENGQLLSVPIENSFIPYFVQFIEKPKGLSLKKERILKEYKETFYGYEDFENKLFEIRLVRYDMFIQNRPIRNQLKLNSMYIHFRRMADMTHYIGRVVSMTAGKLIDFSRLGDVEIEICGDVKNGNMEIALTKDGDGLLLDRPNRKILDDLDDLNAPDIYSYVINLEKREECR